MRVFDALCGAFRLQTDSLCGDSDWRARTPIRLSSVFFYLFRSCSRFLLVTFACTTHFARNTHNNGEADSHAKNNSTNSKMQKKKGKKELVNKIFDLSAVSRRWLHQTWYAYIFWFENKQAPARTHITMTEQYIFTMYIFNLRSPSQKSEGRKEGKEREPCTKKIRVCLFLFPFFFLLKSIVVH